MTTDITYTLTPSFIGNTDGMHPVMQQRVLEWAEDRVEKSIVAAMPDDAGMTVRVSMEDDGGLVVDGDEDYTAGIEHSIEMDQCSILDEAMPKARREATKSIESKTVDVLTAGAKAGGFDPEWKDTGSVVAQWNLEVEDDENNCRTLTLHVWAENENGDSESEEMEGRADALCDAVEGQLEELGWERDDSPERLASFTLSVG